MSEERIIELIKKQYLIVDRENGKLFHLWYENIFLGWEWWLGVILTFLPWLIWIKVRPKESSDRLLYVGLIVVLITCGLDFLGVILGLWFYIYKVIPIIPSFAPYDFSILPVTVLLLLQCKQNISPFTKAIFFAFLGSFVGEPLFKWLHFYQEIHWNSFYSFPIYFVIYLFANWVSKRNGFDPFLKGND
ncbi:CBO0543 family protein [Metabacillus litoralis]|uniref:CBO0543 family protein n=1 Tax=Metabacillus litoralis TaxID=152268 RepID=UPI00203C6684|nr:CBO0543 family protein [Metabacillus litoralis]MCM3651801.1 hypothetical protein [Metabacillus litoralis]